MSDKLEDQEEATKPASQGCGCGCMATEAQAEETEAAE
jgi:hypothetical protein